MNQLFRPFAQTVSRIMGSPWAFLAALAVILAWAVSGSFFGYSDTWQLVINTGTTIVTFLMVFLIQNTQNRDAKALHLKLDELLRAVTEARTRLVALEELSDVELDHLHDEFQRLKHSPAALAAPGVVVEPPPRTSGNHSSPAAASSTRG
jgi:low affinity Fe/Cu permease